MEEASTPGTAPRMRFSEETLAQLPYAVVIVDSSGLITYANRAAEILFGEFKWLVGRRYDSPAIFLERGRTLQRADFEGNPIEPAPPHTIEEVLGSGEPYEDALFVLTTAGHARRFLSADVVPLHSELGGVIGAAAIYRDVTELEARRFEADWLQRELGAAKRQVDELLRLSDALNAINDTIHSTLDAGTVLRSVLREAATAMGVESARLDLREGDGWSTRTVFGISDISAGTFLTDVEVPEDAIVALTGQPFMIADTQLDSRFDAQAIQRERVRAILAVPLLVRGRVVGAVSFHHSYPGSFGAERISFASKFAATTSLAMENARVYEEERHIADTLQQALLVIPADVQGVRSEHLYQSATEAAYVGGDFFDLFQLSADRVGIIIGDVSGKGVEASTLASFTRQLLRAHASEGLTPAQVVERTNELVFRASRTEDFVTLFFGILSLTDGELTFCNAGHPAPIVCRDRKAHALRGSGPLTGAWGELQWSDRTVPFANGDLLLLYTDGVIEAKRDGDLFGEERLVTLVQGLADAPLAEVPRAVLSEVTDFAEGNLRDDVAILAVSPQS